MLSLINSLTSLNIFELNKSVVVFNENSYINYILIIFILISLLFTFNKKSTTVHKVLGLLLSSIFVVFLWILQTQFLFIYIVYILAFISAVLMLFLSVVLMLPISTNILWNKTKILKNNFSILVFINNDLCLIIKFVIIILIVLFITTYCLYKYKFASTSNNLYYNIKILLSNFLITIAKLFSAVIDYVYTNYNFLYIFNIDLLYLTVKYYIVYFKNLILVYYSLLIELVFQFILYFGFFLLVLSSFLFKQTWFQNINDLYFDISSGIGQIKLLLYGDFSLFLIFSTIVLLVALFGAAIMTRSSK
jgi:NADH:ubiquinone oxidoreductase subunit 6 (subunit J)